MEQLSTQHVAHNSVHMVAIDFIVLVYEDKEIVIRGGSQWTRFDDVVVFVRDRCSRESVSSCRRPDVRCY